MTRPLAVRADGRAGWRRAALAASVVGSQFAAMSLVPIAAVASPRCVEAGSDDPATGRHGSLVRTTGGFAPDTPQVTRRELDEVDRDLADVAAAASATRTGQREVDVHVHVIHTRSIKGPDRDRARRQIRVLRRAYDGRQSGANVETGFTFRLKSFERVRNAEWYDAEPGGKDDRQMRSTLHRGNLRDLNVYILAPTYPGGGGIQLLGWSSLPWQVNGEGRQDGITLHQATLFGNARGFSAYNRGDTLVHEAGHWLGLLHTFQGGCSDKNDRVGDTPPQGEPSSDCEPDTDTCSLPGLDPVHNFMDYSPDACMNQFTSGQKNRMKSVWTKYRPAKT